MRFRLAVLAAALGAAAIVPAVAQASTEMLVNESFTGTTMSSSNWSRPAAPSGTNVACLTAGTSTSATPVPGCGLGTPDPDGSGALRLTANAGNLEGGVGYALSVPTVDGIDAVFNSYQYGKDAGADGIGFFLAAANPSDPKPPASIGQAGGSLGYSGSSTAPGMTYGYLGIGLDVYGNYANTAFEGSGCADPPWDSKTTFPNEVSVRGPGNGTVGYCMLNSTSSATMPGTLDGGASGTRSSSQVPVEVVINPTSSSVTTSGLTVPPSSYEVAFKPIGASRQTLGGSLPDASAYLPSGWYDPSTGIPYQLTFGWVGSTGGDMEVHEVNNVQAGTANGIPPTLSTSVSDDAGGAPAGGSTVNYDVAVTNQTGTSDDPGPISVTDTLPSGETPSSAGLGGTGWNCSISGQAVSCQNAGPLATAASLPTLVVPATVSAGAGTVLTNSVTASSDDSDPASGQHSVTVATPPTDTSTCGTANGDNGWYATDPTCTVQGTDANPGLDHVAYQLDSGTIVTTGSGTTTASAPISTDGTHTLKTEVFNTSGQGSGWRMQTITVDTTAPADTSSCGRPDGQNGYFVTDPTCTVHGTDTTSGVDHVAYQLDGGSIVTTGPGTTTASVPISSDGTHTLRTRVYDAAGNDSGWSTQTIRVLVTAPGAPVVDAPVAGVISNNVAPAVTVTGEPGMSATVDLDGVQYGPVTLDGSGEGQIQIPGPLSDGPHTVRAEQTDIAGNVGPWSSGVAWTVKTRTSAGLTGPTSGPINVATPTVDYTGEPGDQFTITVDGQSVATGVIPSGGAGSLTLPAALADGAHTIAITATDAIGNQASAAIVVTIDTDAPATPRIVTAPAQLTASTSATFSFTDAKSPVSYRCSLDGGPWSPCPTPVTFSGLSDGPHSLLVTALDDAGNLSPGAQYAWTIKTSSPPAPTILGGPNTYGVPSASQFEISSQPGTALECSLDGAAFTPCSRLVSLAALPLGGHSLRVRQVDEAGNTSPAATYHWVVLRRRGPRGLPRAATLLVARNATAAGARTLQVGCDLNAGSVRRCRVLAYYHGVQVGEGVASPAHRGQMHSIVTVSLNARGRALLGHALGGLPVKLVGHVKPFGFGALPARNRTVIGAPLRFLLPDVLFDFDSWQLTPAASRIVREMAGELRGARTVVCQGNTDSYGARAYNYWLGLARAETVCATLHALGVHAQMSSASYGAQRPVASNATSDGRHLNRRVLVRVSYYDLPRKRRIHSLAQTLQPAATISF